MSTLARSLAIGGIAVTAGLGMAACSSNASPTPTTGHQMMHDAKSKAASSSGTGSSDHMMHGSGSPTTTAGSSDHMMHGSGSPTTTAGGSGGHMMHESPTTTTPGG